MLSAFKQQLRRIRWIDRLNARWKATTTKKEYAATVLLYSRKVLPGKRVELLVARLGERRKIFSHQNRTRIFFLGTDEAQDRGGILQALNRIGELTYFTRSDGCYGHNHPGSATVRRRANTERLRTIFADLYAHGATPELLIAQTWASFIDPKVFGEIRERYGTIIVSIAMDDRHQYWGHKVDGEWGGTYGLIPYLDLALTAAPECVEWYLKEGCPSLFLPEASDPGIFYPMPELPKTHDVVFVGARYGIREQIVTALRSAGIEVVTYGNGWESGRIANTNLPQLFAQARLVLGVSAIGHCEDFVALKLRDFDGPMSGSCYLTQDNPDLYDLYQVGQEIVTYRSAEECVAKTRYLLAHERERESIARAGRIRAERDHTWDKRFRALIETLRETPA